MCKVHTPTPAPATGTRHPKIVLLEYNERELSMVWLPKNNNNDGGDEQRRHHLTGAKKN